MSLYSKYVEEVGGGREVIEDEISFIAYYRHPDQIYIEDTYILPEHRNGKVFADMFQKIVAIANKHSIDTITHAIIKTHSDFEIMEKRSLRYGFIKVGETETECCYLRSLKNG